MHIKQKQNKQKVIKPKFKKKKLIKSINEILIKAVIVLLKILIKVKICNGIYLPPLNCTGSENSDQPCLFFERALAS